jgi:hypothetical protein
MFILDRLLVGGIRFVLDKVSSVADAELNDADRLGEQLLLAQMQLELGEIDEEEFAGIEADILPRLREARNSGSSEPGLSVTVSVDMLPGHADGPEGS